MGLTVLFGIIHESYCTIRLTTFIYSIFSKKIQFQQNKLFSNLDSSNASYLDLSI